VTTTEYVETKRHRASPPNATCTGRVFFFVHIAVSCCAERPFYCACTSQIGGVYRVSGLPFGQIRTDASLPGVRLLRPNRGLLSHQAIFLFGQIRTDASLQACVYSGRIVASFRVKRFFSSVKSGPTHHSRRAFTPAESWPRSASSGFSLRSRR
jgi:hypothetical protein